jgi:hypothetical protein
VTRMLCALEWVPLIKSRECVCAFHSPLPPLATHVVEPWPAEGLHSVRAPLSACCATPCTLPLQGCKNKKAAALGACVSIKPHAKLWPHSKAFWLLAIEAPDFF